MRNNINYTNNMVRNTGCGNSCSSNCNTNYNNSCNINHNINCDNDCNDNCCINHDNYCNDNHNSNYNDNCNINNMPIGMAYVPWQHWNDIYDIEKGFKVGTIFAELNKPYLGRRCYK